MVSSCLLCLGAESHGGYTFTSLAALTLLDDMKSIKRPESLLRWLTNRQMTVEGGFSGNQRTGLWES